MELDPDFRIDWPIRQGDIFGFRAWDQQPPLQRYGVVVTADCDIAQGRPDQELVFVKIVTQFDYIDMFWSRSKLERAEKRAFDGWGPRLNKIRRELDATVSDLTRSEVEQWVRASTNEDIISTLAATNEGQQAQLKKSLDRHRPAIECAAIPPGECCFESLLKVRSETRAKLLSQAAGELKSQRDELFFVTSIKEASDQTGYYVLLDQIGAIRRDQISDSLSEVKQGKKLAYRFGRLSKTFKYALTQKFAFLFQRIGLPVDHSERHNDCLTRLQ